MALMFQRLARNFARNGYFPTDRETLSRILQVLQPAETGTLRILDPCAGEGTALAECKQHLGAERTHAYGIEYHEARAWHAKSLLDRCIHADFQNCTLGQRGFGLLFLNPPYGDLMADRAETGTPDSSGRKRLEKLFFSKAFPSLQWGGVLVFILPSYSLDKTLAQSIAANFSRVKVFRAPEDRFKQVVMFGVRERMNSSDQIMQTRHELVRIGQGELPPVLPEAGLGERYVVPAITQSEVKFQSVCIDAKQLAEDMQKNPGLWPQFDTHFGQFQQATRRPLMNLSRWHLALALAAGHITGLVQSKTGKRYVIKGDTYKEVIKKCSIEQYEDEYVEIVTETDRFVTVIRALDLTPHSPSYGDVLTIR